MLPIVFFDGNVAKARAGTLATGALFMIKCDGIAPVSWPSRSIVVEKDFADELVLRLAGLTDDARLVIRDPAAIREAKAALPQKASFAAAQSSQTRRVIFWSLSAVAALGVLLFVALPRAADYLAPMTPWSWEQTIANGIDDQFDKLLGGTAVACGLDDQPGRAALEKLVARLEPHADIAVPLDVRVTSNAMINAFALPGAQIRMLSGLLEKAETPDEFAAVLSHEMGHVHHRDVMRLIIHYGGVGFVLGSIVGDFAGGAAVIIVAQQIVNSTYSREAERRADTFAVDLMRKAGADESAARRFFERVFVPMDQGSDLSILSSHPVTAERVAAFPEKPAGSPAPLLTDEEWAALKAICAEE